MDQARAKAVGVLLIIAAVLSISACTPSKAPNGGKYAVVYGKLKDRIFAPPVGFTDITIDVPVSAQVALPSSSLVTLPNQSSTEVDDRRPPEQQEFYFLSKNGNLMIVQIAKAEWVTQRKFISTSYITPLSSVYLAPGYESTPRPTVLEATLAADGMVITLKGLRTVDELDSKDMSTLLEEFGAFFSVVDRFLVDTLGVSSE